MTRITNILVANRGEIAIRIFRACNELGIHTTAIYSHADRLSIHRYKADQAFLVGTEDKPVEAYLDGDAIIKLAKEHGVDAIHPGYGFLSENADFAEKCEKAGLIWIGPPSHVMRKLGDKVSARRVAIEAGIPVVPGTENAVQTVEEAVEFAKTAGFPLLIKAANGGGGRGMRVVRSLEEVPDQFKAARNESINAFGSAELFIERFIEHPRHIEVQLVCDEKGNKFHCFERDCSVQRRHQKVVEIAPAPNLEPETADRLHQYALQLAKSVNYQSVGTVEFLVERIDGKDHIYFIEVNTRIQVEHTVTEMVTGYDLIRTMILVAEGFPLTSDEIDMPSQEAIATHGFAIQCRITTEDPLNDFSPDYGKIATYRSAAGFGIRLDAGIAGSGAIVEPFYDSLLVKVSAWGRNLRDSAQRLHRSLREFRIRGVKTNIPFLINVVSDERFLEGDTNTRYIDESPHLFDFPRRRDRGTKALRAIGDIIINGPPGAKKKFTRPDPLFLPNLPECPKGKPPESEAYQIFKERGAEGLAKWIRDHKKLLITDTTFRDAHQSLLATRVRTNDLAKIARPTQWLTPNLFSYEMWGGATFDVALRFLMEDPWKRLDEMKKQIPGALFQMLFRGKNAVGYANYPDDVIRSFIQEAAKGIDIFRIFDALNYVPNMELAIEEVAKSGKIVEATICYSGDILDPHEDKFTLDYYKTLAKELVSRGTHILCIKDMAGLIKPYAGKVLIEELKATVDVPIHLHTHDTSGNGVAMYLMAAQADVDIVDCAISSMAGLTSQPSLNSLVCAMEGQPNQPDLDVDKLQILADYWELQRDAYAPFESGLKASTTDVYHHEIPGGQYSNFRPRAIELGLGNQWAKLKETYADVNKALGRIIKVTPTSKVVADFSMFLVRNDLTIQELTEKLKAGEKFDFPGSIIDFFSGRIGIPHDGFPKELQQLILNCGGDDTPEEPPKLTSYDWDKDTETLKTLLGHNPTKRDAISYALYPRVFKAFAETIDQFGEYEILPTVTFLYGMEHGEETMLEIESGKTLVVKYINHSQPNEKGDRIVYFELNGQSRQIAINDKNVKSKVARREKADKSNPLHIGASMQGKVMSVNVKPGDEVVPGFTVATTEAMKMETSVTATQKATIERVLVSVGDEIEAGDLVAVCTA